MLMRWGGGTAQAEEIAALPEEPASNLVGNASSLIRAINALSDNVSVLLGEGAAPSLPTTAADILNTAPIAPGSTLPASPDQLGKVDSYGYQNFIPASLNLVFTKAGDTSQSALTLQTTANSQVISTFLIVGDPGDVTNAHPVRGLYCEDKDTLAAGGSGTTVGDGGAGSLNSLDDSLLADCSFSPLPVLSFDIANLSLYGANAPFESSRQQVIDGINGFTSPVGARTSAFMCILEADRGSDKTNIINAAGTGPNGSGSFPYSYFASSTIATQPTLPADQKPTPQYAPCGGSVSQTTVTDLFNCVEGSCDTLGNDVGTGAGVLSGGTQCFSNGPCFIDFAHLYTNLHGPPRTGEPIQNDSCFDCLIYDMTSDQTYATVQTECNDDVQPFAFDGQTPGMILSKYPIVSSLVYYLPVTGYRRAVLKVQAQLEDQKLDFFCAQLTSPFVDGDLPYVGNFGSDALEDGGTTGNGWEQEQDLQATEAVTWITQQIQADGVAAIVATDLHSSPGASQGTDDGGGIVTASQSPEVLATFNGGQGFVPAIPNGFTETCDYCPAPENPYNGDALPYELMHAWTVGFPPNAIQTESNWGNDNSQVQLTATAGQTLPPGGTGPLFEYYAHNYTVIRPTPK
jgi:hypothetical protein